MTKKVEKTVEKKVEEKNIKKRVALELVETPGTRFTLGLVRDKEGKLVYANKKTNADNSLDEKGTKLIVKFYVPAQEKDETINVDDYLVSLEKLKLFKAAGCDLSQKSPEPYRIRFSVVKVKDETFKLVREFRTLTNLAIKVDGNWQWIIQSSKSEEPAKEKKEVVDDLPF